MTSEGSSARREASDWYLRLREEEADDTVRAAFADWLGADPSHAEAWRSMCETMEVVGRAPAGWQTPVLSSRNRRRRTSPAGGRAGQRKRRLAIATGAVAATAAFALALPSLILHLRADHITAAADVELVRLADGSTIEIGPDSAITVDYRENRRTVRLLSGQAMFDVVHDAARPFQVAAGEVTTTVLGTRFDVRMLGDTTSVAVARGRVRVADAGGTRATARDLLAGDWVRIDAAHDSIAGKVSPQLVGGWSHGEAVAENRTIASIIDEIRPWFVGKIVISDPLLANRRVTGIYNVKDPAQALAMIVQPYGGRITRITPWLLIVSGT